MSESSLPPLVTNPPRPPPATPPLTVVQNQIALYGYAILFLLGFLGHTSSLLIFLRPTLNRISTSCLFIALTISDSIYLLVSIYDFLNIGLKLRDASVDASAMCRFRHFIQWTAMCCNAWFLVAIAVDRWIRVRFPFKSKQLCTPRKALLVALAIVILCAGFNAHTLSPSYGQLPAGVMTVCGPRPTNAVYNTFVRQIWPTMFSLAQTILPVVLLLAFSIDTCRRLTRTTVARRQRSSLDQQILVLMLVTIALFVATTLPAGLFNILLTPVLRGFMNQVQLLELSSIVTLIATINYTLDFYLHCLTSRLFRQELLRVFKPPGRNSQVAFTTNSMRINATPMTITRIQVQ